MSMLKRQRELHKAEKAARKRARRHGHRMDAPAEPRPTVDLSALPLKPAAEEEKPAAPTAKEAKSETD